MRVWAEASLSTTFAAVAECGRSIIPCASAREARLFRQALYGHQRRNPHLPEISARIAGTDLIIVRRTLRTPNGVPPCQS